MSRRPEWAGRSESAVSTEALDYIMAVLVLSIVCVTLVLFAVEIPTHVRAIFRAIFRTADFDGSADDDPCDVGMNDKDIL
jgi:hypothetical protein